MTEAEFLASTDPAAMLERLRNGLWSDAAVNRISERQLRLWACSCCRQVWDGVPCKWCQGGKFSPGYDYRSAQYDKCTHCHGSGRIGGLSDERSRRAVEVAEKFADGLATADELAECGFGTTRPSEPLGWIAARCCWEDAAAGAQECVAGFLRHGILSGEAMAVLLREIVGNPYRPARLSPVLVGGNMGLPEVRPSWLSSTVVGLARQIYDDRDFGLMPVLSDALQDSGCDDEAILTHCRDVANPCPVSYPHMPHDYCDGSPAGNRPVRGLHCRGCWCLDLLLNKE